MSPDTSPALPAELTITPPDSEPTAPSEPITLESLQQYASSQTKLIESVSESPLRFRTPENAHWIELWSTVWGKNVDSLDNLEQVESGPDSRNNSLIFPGVIPSDRKVMSRPDILKHCWESITYEKILIRSEYWEAEEFILSICGSERNYNVVVVTGQPGIGLSHFCSAMVGSPYLLSGKSVFLLRTLLHRLALKLPTALQLHPNSTLGHPLVTI